ncbi:MAG TPA: ATP-binding protein [Candidatus Limnocylindria bacterium]|nr:ATP-binding protein [Candidatus Limnocylindria bacterium]
MGRSAAADEARERAHLLIRLAAIALGGTLVLLGGAGVLSLAAGALLLYLAATVVMRYLPAARRVGVFAPAVDLVAITALVFAFPLDLAPWVLYAFAIGAAALRSGPAGAVTATALAVVGYDLALIVRGAEARAADLWPVQALIAIGLVTAELVWALGRSDVDTVWSRVHSRALGALTRQREPDELLRTLVHELARLRNVRGAWVWKIGPDQPLRATASAGATPAGEITVSAERARALRAPAPLDRIVPEMTGLTVPVSIDPPLTVGVSLEPGTVEDRAATTGAIHDLVGDAASLLAAAFERVRRDEEKTALEATIRAIGAVDGERTRVAVLASCVLEAGRLVNGRAAIFRLAEGTVLAGDLPGDALLELARDRRLPAITPTTASPAASAALGSGVTIALVGLSEGRVLAVAGPAETLSARLPLLERLGQATRGRLALLAERDELQSAAKALGRDVESLGGALRAKEETLATAVHELRNPLTAVHGYATLMSRNLQAVQGQLAQLERLMADLLSTEQRAPGAEAAIDAVTEARDAIARARVRGATIALDAPPEPVRLAIGQARFAQLLDNLIANAMKYSTPSEPIVVRVGADEGHGTVSVTDHGIGIPSEHLALIFDRFYRVGGTSDAVAGQGLGLSICKEIVTAHGGRIWAESEGPGRGSTFSFTLPLALPTPAA